MALTSGNAQVVITDSTTDVTDATPSGSYTVGAGTELLLVAAILQESTALTGGGVGEVAALTYNGQALTRAVFKSGTSPNKRAEFWSLLDPPVGSHTLAATLDAKTDSYAFLAVEVHGGVNHSTPIGGTGTSEANSGNATKTVDVVSTVDGSLLFAALATYGGGTAPLFTPTNGDELIDDVTGSAAGADTAFWLAERLTTTAGTYTLSATTSAATAYAMVGLEVLPSIDGVVVAAGTQGHTVASPGLAQIHALAAVAATQGHTTTAPFAGLQAFPVSVVAGHIVAAPGIVQAAVLKTVVGTQGHSVASPALVQVNTLRSVSATTGHTITVGGLAQANLLLSVSPLTGHTVAAGGMLQQQIARVADALAGHIADPSKIVASLAMSVANVLTGHTVNVGMLHVLIPGQSPIEQTYAVLEDGRVYRIVGRGEGIVIPSETRNIDITPWGDLVQ